MTAAMLLGAASLTAWLYLILGRGHFWLCTERDHHLVPPEYGAPLDDWPSVVAVVPARNEARLITSSIGSLLQQDYPGRFTVVLVDDGSCDGTATVARDAALRMGAARRLTVIRGTEPPSSWTGKLWAMSNGLRYVEALPELPAFVFFADADIAFEPGVLRRLVEGACARGTVLTSLMVKLRCRSLAEGLFIPAFIFFFQKLYPFAWVNDPSYGTAAAAGGCMLVRPEALRRAGGLEAMRGALIDDCALGALLKRQGPVWLGLTESARSLRATPGLGDIRRMVSRSAYAQLRYSPLALFGVLASMGFVYVAPPLMAAFAQGTTRNLGLASWGLMTLAFIPTLRFYRLNPAWALALPAIAAMYMAFTVDSGLQHWRGRGGEWKGRFQSRSWRRTPELGRKAHHDAASER